MLSFRFGDENVYFYMSKAILDGLMPYRDFFLADPPFFPLLLSFWKLLVGSKLILLKLWPIIFDSATAILIFLILKKRQVSLAVWGTILYLFSFTVLSTSDYITGGEAMVFFVTLALLLDEYEKYFLSGLSWALACLSKLYAAPALIGFLIYKLIKKDISSLKAVILGGLLTSLILIAPFLALSPNNFLENIVFHQFSRPPGLNKVEVLLFFGRFEWLLLLTALASTVAVRSKKFLWPLGLSILFFLWYSDLYYLYLHLIIPFLVILSVEFLEFLREKSPDLVLGYLLLYVMLAVYPIYHYVSTTGQEGVFHNPREISEALESAPGSYSIFGAQEVAPLLALMSQRPIFDNIIDSNTQSFASGAQNRDQVSLEAVREGVYLVSRIAEYPELEIKDFGFDGYFDPAVFRSSCELYRSFDRPLANSEMNKVNIYYCYNPNI